ncbi:hypothetical protein [Azospirillum sp. B4]|uniref:hypothetical protein n=1 Tax=Azospirillum sp. B4 TaxID=95605 RepID=UPI00034582F9|nr:hypothetical protein [Azospirillum sp. B4]
MAVDARENCKEIIRNLVPPDLWASNQDLFAQIFHQVKEHPLLSDPVIAALGKGEFTPEQLAGAHLEFHYAFAQNFTDALLRAMLLTNRIQPRLGAAGKVAARFLLEFNLLDELGFTPAAPGASGYGGSPVNAHYVKFFETLGQLGIPESHVAQYTPSPAAADCHRMVEAAGDDLIATLTILAVEETIFESFATPWASNMRQRTTVDTEHGYHAIHVEQDGELLDDEHAEDLWYVLQAALTPDRYDDVRRITASSLDTVHRFVRSLANA